MGEWGFGESPSRRRRKHFGVKYPPQDKTNFHVDPGGKTYMFYLNKDWKRRWGSYTIFRRNGMVKVFPKPGRLVVFDASIEHKGTAPTFLFPNSIAGRFSIAFHEK